MATRRARKVSRSIQKVLANQGQSADSEVLLSAILKQWGGPDSLARDIKTTFDAAPDGSMIRQRLMEMIQRLIINNTKEEITNELDPSDMSDEDLAEAANQLVGRLIQAGDEDDDDGGPETGPEADAGDDPPDGRGVRDEEGEETVFF